MSGSGREALPGGREVLLNVREWSGGPAGCTLVVARPSRMSESAREAHPGCQGVVVRPSWMDGSGREALSDVWE